MSFDPETREIHCNKKWKEIAIKVEGNSNQSGRKQKFLKIEYEKVEVEWKEIQQQPI